MFSDETSFPLYDLLLKKCNKMIEEDPKNKDINTMVELGCHEAYYSAVFNEMFHNKCKNIMVDLCIACWEKFGKVFFENKKNTYFYNNYMGEIIWACWGGQDNPDAMRFKSEIKKIPIVNK